VSSIATGRKMTAGSPFIQISHYPLDDYSSTMCLLISKFVFKKILPISTRLYQKFYNEACSTFWKKEYCPGLLVSPDRLFLYPSTNIGARKMVIQNEQVE